LLRPLSSPLPRGGGWPGTIPVGLKKLPQELLFPEWQPTLARQMIESGEFRFLNQSMRSRGRIPWSAEGHPRLWTYHLNYCDFLNVGFNAPDDPTGAALRAALGIALDWREQNATGSKPGWEPYPLSLRIVNWLKFLVRNAARAEALGEGAALACLLASLRVQVLALEQRLEKDLLANHLLKNIKALMFAGALLDAPESRRWWATGLKLLRREISEQILPDGGHFERSPMYHALALEDLLDISGLSPFRQAAEVESGAESISEPVARMKVYLSRILHPDGEIPLFNDSAFGMARLPSELLARHVTPTFGKQKQIPRSARDDILRSFSQQPVTSQGGSDDVTPRVFRSTPADPACGNGTTTYALADTGYAVIRDADAESCLVFDAGPLGPDYQPGHGHCDILSYELSLHCQRVVVDTGVSTYEPGPERHYERSTAAHNTLRIDGEEQAEIWGVFRVGRRPHVGRLSVGEVQQVCFARGEYMASREVVQSRTVFGVPGNCWVVADRLRGRGLHHVESFVHFHPSVRLKACEPRCNRGTSGADTVRRRALVSFGRYHYVLMTLGPGEPVVIESWYSPEFGLRLASQVLSLTGELRLPGTMVHAFVPAGSTPPVVGLVQEGKAIEINGRVLPLE
jgi:uncharacterized heparinase superfamily protein